MSARHSCVFLTSQQLILHALYSSCGKLNKLLRRLSIWVNFDYWIIETEKWNYFERLFLFWKFWCVSLIFSPSILHYCKAIKFAHKISCNCLLIVWLSQKLRQLPAINDNYPVSQEFPLCEYIVTKDDMTSIK